MGSFNSPNFKDERGDNTGILEAELIKKGTKFTIGKEGDEKKIALVAGVIELEPGSTIEVINVEEEVLKKIRKDNKKNENQEKDDEKGIIKFVKKYFSYILSLGKSGDVPGIDISKTNENEKEKTETQEKELLTETRTRTIVTLKISSPSGGDEQKEDFSLNILISYLNPLQSKIKKIK